MYNKPFNIWDEDKLSVMPRNDSHSSSPKYGSIHPGENKPVGYNEAKYGLDNRDAEGFYNSSKNTLDEEDKDKNAENEEGTLSSLVDQEAKKEQRSREEGIAATAASPVIAETGNDSRPGAQAKESGKKSIEEAINRAIRQEKEVIVLG